MLRVAENNSATCCSDIITSHRDHLDSSGKNGTVTGSNSAKCRSQEGEK